MSTASVCQVCGTASAADSCELCGRLVCADHYDRTQHACSECTGDADGGQVFR